MKPFFQAGTHRLLVIAACLFALAGLLLPLPAFSAADCSANPPKQEQYLKDQGIDPSDPCPAYDKDLDSRGHACSKAARNLGEAWDLYVQAREKTCAASRELEAYAKLDNCSNGQAACDAQAKTMNDKAKQAANEELATIKEVQKRVTKLREASLELARRTAKVVQQNYSEFESSGPDKKGAAAMELKAKNNIDANNKLGNQDPSAAKQIVKNLEQGDSQVTASDLKSPQLHDTARLAATANHMQQDLAERQSHLGSIVSGTSLSSRTLDTRGNNLGSETSGSKSSGMGMGDMASMAGLAGAAGSGLSGSQQSAANSGGVSGYQGTSPYQYDPNYNIDAGGSNMSGASSTKSYGVNSQGLTGNGGGGLPGAGKSGVGPGPSMAEKGTGSGPGAGFGGSAASSDPGGDSGMRLFSSKTSSSGSLGGGGFGGGSAGKLGTGGSMAASDKDNEEAGTSSGGASSNVRSPASGGGGGELGLGGMDSTLGTGDFSLSSSETDAAVKNMVADFTHSLEGDGTAGSAGAQPSAGDILSGESKTLFKRAKEAHLRALKRGNLIDHGKIRI